MGGSCLTHTICSMLAWCTLMNKGFGAEMKCNHIQQASSHVWDHYGNYLGDKNKTAVQDLFSPACDSVSGILAKVKTVLSCVPVLREFFADSTKAYKGPT